MILAFNTGIYLCGRFVNAWLEPSLFNASLQWGFSGLRRVWSNLSSYHCGKKAGSISGIWRDNAAHDMTIHSSASWNCRIKSHPNTFYFSFVHSMLLQPHRRPSGDNLVER